MSQSVATAAHCINPDCPRPSVQPWGNKFCNSCGASLELKNRYIPLERLGSGGFAAIYTVWDLQTKGERVLKVLVETSPKALELFEQEAAVLASLRHPGVPNVEPDSYFHLQIVVPHERSLPCLVMEKINGQTLQDILDEHPQGCPEASVLNWLNQSLEILDELHRRQIIHRDLKPSNLMVRRENGQLVAIDFGGAKQIGSIRRGSQVSSTRLISPGYSPPEQISGGAVGPAADFYALGRTMIHLLTGKYPGDLEDPVSGELSWRNQAQIGQYFADLLDEMVQADVRQRPATAAQIKRRLAGISTMNTTPSWAASKVPESLYKIIGRVVGSGFKLLFVAIASVSKALVSVLLFFVQAIAQVVRACLDTFWEMLLGGLGGLIGATAGFGLAYGTELGDRIASILTQQLPPSVTGEQIIVGPQIILFGLAGLGTAVALNEAGGFGQQRRSGVAGIVGVFGYGLGWLILQAAESSTSVGRLVGLLVMAVVSLTLGLGLPSHHLVHALVAAAGTCTVFTTLVALNPSIADSLVKLFFTSSGSSDFWNFLHSITFFSVLGITIAFWLGVSYYVFVPFLRWLGWR